MDRPLTGLRVADFSRGFPGTLTAMILADHGAEVARVEPPGGDRERARAAFRMWRRGQKSIVLDLHTADGREQAVALAAGADILIQNWRPGVAEALGLGYASLSSANPELIYCAISGFGSRGPYAKVKAYEGIVGAKAGRFSLRGAQFGMTGRAGPIFLPSPHASYGAAQVALQGILAALYVRGSSGRGQKVETSLVQGLCAFDVWDWIIDYLGDEHPDQYRILPPVSASGVPLSPYYFTLLVAPAKDGRWFQFANVLPHMWQAFMKAMDLGEEGDDPAFAGAPNFATEDASLRFWNLLIRRLQGKSYDDWMAVFLQDDNIAADAFRTTEEALDHPQMGINGHVVEVDDPGVGRMRQIGPQVTLWGTPAEPVRPAPALGANNAELAALSAPRKRSSGGGALPGHALDGVTVLELGTFFAAPFGPTLVGELGARVIKVEPLSGDPVRWGMPIPESGAVKATQGKESLAVDIGTDEGRQIVYEIARKCDLVMCSYRTGVAERQKVDYETLRRFNPDIVYLHGTAYGLEGDYPRHPVYGPTPPAIAGEALYQLGQEHVPVAGETVDGATIRDFALKLRAVNPGLGDPIAALGVATGMLLGLVARQRLGVGQKAMTTMICSAAYIMSDDFLAYEGKPARALPDAGHYGMGPLYRLYECAGGWVFLACPKESEWAALCNALAPATGGRAKLDEDARFASAAGRDANADALANALADLFATRFASDWEADLMAADVACVKVAEQTSSRFILRDPLMLENGFVTDAMHFSLGPYRRSNLHVNLSLTPGRVGEAPAIGAHTYQILRELGSSESRIHELEERGIIRVWEGVDREEPVASER